MRTLNRAGMVWEEWANAAGIVPPMIILPISEFNAWRNGEDPTEWRRAAEIEKIKGRGRRNG